MEFDELVAQMQDAEQALINAQSIYDARKQAVVDWMGEHQEKTRVAPYGDGYVQVTRIVRETVAFDTDRLIEMIGKRAYNKLTVSKIDRKLVELAVRDGRILPEIVEATMQIKESDPFLKVTAVKEVPEDAA